MSKPPSTAFATNTSAFFISSTFSPFWIRLGRVVTLDWCPGYVDSEPPWRFTESDALNRYAPLFLLKMALSFACLSRSHKVGSSLS